MHAANSLDATRHALDMEACLVGIHIAIERYDAIIH
jgi:hypothetical protein